MIFQNHAVISFVRRAETPIAVDTSGRRISEMEQQIASWSDELHSIVGAARELRAEAEGFVNWANYMGENVLGSPTWGANQQACAAHWRAHYRPLAAQWKAEVANYYGVRAAEAVDYFWGDECKGQHPADTTKSARAELGL